MKSPPGTQLPVQNATGIPSLHRRTEALLTQVQTGLTGHETGSRKMQKDVVCEIWPCFLEKMGSVLPNLSLFWSA